MSRLDAPVSPHGPSLSRGPQLWSARLPGLGSLVVDADGSVHSELDGAEADPGQFAALELGWGELLGWQRRGALLSRGATLTPPLANRTALLVTGEPLSLAGTILGLADRGWSLLSDQPSPLMRQARSFVGCPRSAPLLIPRFLAQARRLDASPIRAGSTTYTTPIPRSDRPATISAIAHTHRAWPDDSAIRVLTGHERLKWSDKVLVNYQYGSADTSVDPERGGAPMAPDDLALAGLPAVALTGWPDDTGTALDALVDWWNSHTQVSSDGPA